MLDHVLPTPRLVEIDRVDLAAPPERVWELVRHGNLASSSLVKALFALRTLPDRLRGKHVDPAIRIDDLVSSVDRPGFQILAEDSPREFVVGAIGKVWHPQIPFVHVASAPAFADFKDAGFVKVAWAIRIARQGELDSKVEFELRVDATDEESWRNFQRYFRVIGPASHFIRRVALTSLERELGTPAAKENERALPGDDLLSDATVQATHGITIAAPAAQIWPWLLQMGCRRAGFYAVDWLDNAGLRSARELHPELLELEVGQVLPATPDGDDGFEVLSVQAPHTLILGGLHDTDQKRQIPFNSARPQHFWHVTWSFVLEPLDTSTTRLHVRARAAFSELERFHASAIRPVHHFMQSAMLRHLAERAEGRLPRDDVRDVLEGLGGAVVMLGAGLSPFLRRARTHWGIDEATANRCYPGDELVAEPRWGWTHGVEIDAPVAAVWPWIAQLGADRGGFYSYQWLENVVGCNIRNAETIHPEWRAQVGQSLVLHPDPKAPRLEIVALESERYLLGYGRVDDDARSAGKPWTTVTWLFFLEPLGEGRCRFVSRYRLACSGDLATRLAFGPTLVEPVGFAMDRRMLLGVKERAEAKRAFRNGSEKKT